MTVEAIVVGQKCNLGCTYCYEEGMRQNEGKVEVNLLAMLHQLKKQGAAFTIFGGEPLLTPMRELEILFKWGYKWYGKNGVQTNGTILTYRHIGLFKKYNVHVGVSVDGPGELNDARPFRSSKVPKWLSARITQKNLEWLLREKIACSLIVTLHALNARGDRLEQLITWLNDLASRGISSARLHFLELDNPGTGPNLRLEDSENAHAVVEIEKRVPGISFDILGEMRRTLMNDFSSVSCIWHGCDPYTTPAVIGVDSDGSLSNCGRANKEGVNWRKASTPGNERLVALYNTPYSEGGCQGCRFFVACKGECPGTGIGGDWRRRTEHCGTLLILFERLEKELVAKGNVPISLAENRKQVEQEVLKRGGNLNIPHEDWHGDSYRVPVRKAAQ